MSTIAPGKKMLMVVSIIGIIIYGFTVLITFFGVAVAVIVPGMWEEIMAIPGGQLLVISDTLPLLLGVYYLYAYIMTIINATKLEKARFLRILGIISVILVICSAIFNLIISFIVIPDIISIYSLESFENVVNAGIIVGFIFGLAIRLVLPIFQIIGANKNIKAHEELEIL